MSANSLDAVERVRKRLDAIIGVLWSWKTMGVVSAICAAGVFVPSRWWQRFDLALCDGICWKHWGWFVVAFAATAASCVCMIVSGCIRSLVRKRYLKNWMMSLTCSEMQALCNAFHHGGKASLAGDAPELKWLEEHGLIVVADRSWGFGEYDYKLTPASVAYFKRNGDYFARYGVTPQKLQEHTPCL